jgi:hypothetical protein
MNSYDPGENTHQNVWSDSRAGTATTAWRLR